MINIIKNKVIYFFILSTFTIIINIKANARWLNKNDNYYDIQFYNTNLDVNEDGTYTENTEIKLTIRKDNQQKNILTEAFTYNHSYSKFKVIEAYTIYKGKKYIVNKNEIENKKIASDSNGFNSISQVLINYTNIKSEAELYLKYQYTVYKNLIPKFYSKNLMYNLPGYLIKSKVKISSKIPLYYKKIDSENLLNIKTYKLKNKYYFELTTKRPYLKGIINENYSYLNINEIPFVSISSENEWNRIANFLSKKYEEILNKKLPPTFEEIYLTAKNKQNLKEKIETVTSLLYKKIKYRGDWRHFENGLFPKSFTEIASKEQGDCKDFAIVTVAILKKLGIDANVAAIYAKKTYQDPLVMMPSLSFFNHMIVHVTNNNKSLWIDPTFFASKSDSILDYLDNRYSLIFIKNNPVLLKTPKLTEDNYKITTNQIITFNDNNIINKEGNVKLIGNSAIFLTSADLYYAKDVIDNAILNILSNQSNRISWKLENYQLKDNIVKDLNFSFKFTEKSTLLKTDLGNGYNLEKFSIIGSVVNDLLINTIDRQSDLFLEKPPLNISSTYLLKEIYRNKPKFYGCEVKAKWGHFSRKIIDNTEGTIVSEQIKIFDNHIINQDLKSNEFKIFQEQLEQCFKGYVIIA